MLYLHVPFCKQACSYCDFHFSTVLKNRRAVVEAMHKELVTRRAELPPTPVQTIYFGGGTPSLLTAEELTAFFQTFVDLGYLTDDPTKMEITLEANPDDLTEEKLAVLAASPVNRLSIGIQSFDEGDLRFMNRAHSAAEARVAVDRARTFGFRDFSIDLIYGGQTTTDEIWQRNLEIATGLGVNHISSYALTVEPGTALGHQVAKGRVPDTDDDRFARQFNILVDHLAAAGYEHYEISNFALPGHRSRHNTGYWTGQPYLGIGPGAHGFDGHATRRWNVSNNARYAKLWPQVRDAADLENYENLLFERELLSSTDRYNEFVMTGLRRSEGLDARKVAEQFGEALATHFRARTRVREVEKWIERSADGQRIRLSRDGLMVADGVAMELFMD